MYIWYNGDRKSAVTSMGGSAENTFSITEEVFFVETISYY